VNRFVGRTQMICVRLLQRTLRACLSAPWKGAELQWESKPIRQLSLQPVVAEACREAMNCAKPLVQKGS